MVVMVVLLMTLPVWSHPFHAVQEHYKEIIMIRRIYPLLMVMVVRLWEWWF